MVVFSHNVTDPDQHSDLATTESFVMCQLSSLHLGQYIFLLTPTQQQHKM